AANVPPVASRFREWQLRQNQGPASASQFIHQTYLAMLARFVARRFVAPGRPIVGDEEFLEVINVDYFSRRGIGNFGEGDIFTWLPLAPRWELGLDDLLLETLRVLAEALAPFDFTNASPGILDALYRETVPRWLAEYVVGEELGLTEDPGLSVLDPACDTGTFLSAAIGAMKQSITQRGDDPMNVMFDAPRSFRGMDSDPLAVAFARLNYLLALGDLVQQEHPEFLLPVYLAGADGVPNLSPGGQGITLSTSAGDFPLPEPFISDPLMLDWVLGRLTNYMDGAQMRLHSQTEEMAVQEVLNAYYNYLTAGKPRTPVPDALTPRDADVLLETARSLVHLHIRGEGTLWLHLVQNLAAPAVFANLGFDRLAGFSSEESLKVHSGLFLRPGGRAVAVTFWADEIAQVVSATGRSVKLQIVDGPIPQDISWADAKAMVQVTEE
ncbi:MAG: hypothetical protein V3S68_01215, partial [Dehalococcoidia bacterium]